MADKNLFTGLHSRIYAAFFLAGFTLTVFEAYAVQFLNLYFGVKYYSYAAMVLAMLVGVIVANYFAARLPDRILKKAVPYLFLLSAVFLLISGLAGARFIYIGALYGPGLHTLLVIVYLAAAMLPVFIFNGGLFPVLTGVLSSDNLDYSSAVANLFIANLLGGLAGINLLYFVLLRYLSFITVIIIIAGLNLIAFLITSSFKLPYVDIAAKISTVPGEKMREDEYGAKKILLLVCLFMSGYFMFLYEYNWFRILQIILSSVYFSFSIVLSAILTGLLAGTYVFKKLLKIPLVKSFDNMLLILFACLGIYNLFMVPVFGNLPLKIFDLAKMEGFFGYQLASYFTLLAILLLPSILLGVMFPYFSALYHATAKSRNGVKSIRVTYIVYNTGALLSLIVPVVYFKMKGDTRGLLVLSSYSAIIFGAGVYLFRQFNIKRVLIAVILLAAPSVVAGYKWDYGILASAPNVYGKIINQVLSGYSGYNTAGILKGEKIIFTAESLESIVTVTKYEDKKFLKINGINQVSTGDAEVKRHLLLGYLPMLLSENNREVLIIGLGSGITAGAAANFDINRLTIVEIDGNVIKASAYFGEYLNIANKKIRIINDDVRSFLFKSDQKYDVVISEPSQLLLSNTKNLLSSEFIRLVKNHIGKNGIFAQWVPDDGLTDEVFASIYKAFLKVFKKVSLWKLNGNLIIIAGDSDLDFNFQRIIGRYNSYVPEKDKQLIELRTLDDLLGGLLCRNRAVSPEYEYIKPVGDYDMNLNFKAGYNYFHGFVLDMRKLRGMLRKKSEN